ncbi:MAG: hypothetical protein GX409_08940 [candidate division Zixibacteria bacterium]|nr:hypothetical protein [candidate division Zixibacteria bacterium]
MYRKLIVLASCAAVIIIMTNPAGSIQVAGYGSGYSLHSYDQTATETAVNQEVLPTIIHTPITEASTSEDFHITAAIQNLGLGVPVAHYRFGDAKKYSKNVMKPIRPDVYDFKILAAALNDKKIEYYIEVVDGSRSLATFGTADHPIVAVLKSPGHNMFYLTLILSFIGLFFVSKVIAGSRKRVSAKDSMEKRSAAGPSKSRKLARIH